MRPSPNRRRAPAALACWLTIALGVPASLATTVRAQEAAEAPAAEPVEEDFSQPMGPADPYNRGTPRGSMYGYIVACREGDYERAAEYLDLRRLPRRLENRGPELARDFKAVLDRTLWVDFTTLSDSNQGFPDDGLPAWQDLLGVIEPESGPVDLLLQRVPREGDQVRIWKVSAATVARVPALYAEFGPGPLEQVLPAFLMDVHLLELALWQWAGLAVSAFLAWLLALGLASAALRLAGAALRLRGRALDVRVARVIRGPVRLALTVGLFAAGQSFLGLPIPAQRWLRGLEQVLVIFAASWLGMRLVDLGALFLRERLVQREQTGLLPALGPARRFTKALVLLFAVLAALGSLGVNVTAALAGVGVGGIAFALAAQKTIENLFGGITLFGDQPVRVGDFCRFGEQVGTVEEIGLRSTRIRTLDRTLVSVPNAEFSSLYLENYSKRDRMRLFTMLGLRYETTPEQLRYVLARLRQLLLAHPKVTPDPARVRFVGFGAYSLDLEVFAYVDTADWNEFLEIREDLYLRMMDVVKEAGTGFAFPSQTTYLGRDDGVDEKQAREAEARVAAWREQGTLPFPHFPESFRREVENTLDWPPAGSPSS